MFTGIIEEIGHLQSIKRNSRSAVLTISADKVLEGTGIGDSIAVNGVCLTVVGMNGNSFDADVMHETLDRSSLSLLRPDSKVNLERAMAANGRFGGHIVAGHVDGTGRITNVKKDDNAVWYTIKADENIMRYIIEKGSVAIDGISLTVADTGRDYFKVSVIPHTRQLTILSDKRAGDIVNIENDCVGKYIEKFMNSSDRDRGHLTKEFLLSNGF
ncbi:MAG: riboflavin synthase [Lachnospira sp.]|nr:riboflavin synthase [Lachnospira sp.]MDD5829227.1 riboflavin synthase [Lachnospira sp.]